MKNVPPKSKFTNPSTFIQATKKPLHHFNFKLLSSLKSYIYDIYSILKLGQFPK